MIKVLHILSCLELGGTEKFIMNHYRHIDREKYQFDFFVFLPTSSCLVEEIQSLGGNVYFGTTPSTKHLFRFYKSLKRVLKTGKYDAVHCHVDTGNAFPLLFSKMLGVSKRVSHSHGSNYFCGSFLNKVVFFVRRAMIRLFATDFLACSQKAGYDLYGRKFFAKKGEVIKNGIDLEEYFSPHLPYVNYLRESFDISENNEFVLGNITRFDDNKNQLFILDMFQAFLKRHPTSVLLLGGIDGGKYEQTVEKAKALSISQNVRFIGPRQDVPACLALMDAYIIASKSEGLSIVALEAQATVKACIASDVLPSETNMGLGNIHYLSLDSSPETWAKQLEEALLYGQELDRQTIERAFIKSGYEIKSSVKGLEEVYAKPCKR